MISLVGAARERLLFTQQHPDARPQRVAGARRVFTHLSVHWFEAGTSAIFAMLVLVRVIPRATPLGVGGLYALMAQTIRNSGFVLPAHIPFYGPGGIPFAYPPLALYVLAALSAIPYVSLLTWMRYVPIAMCALSVWPASALYREILPGRLEARTATLLFTTSPAWLGFDLWADGSVRSFAFFWGILALLLGWRALAGGSRRTLLGASLCFALALASHQEVGIFVALTLFIFATTSRPVTVRLLRLGVIGVLGAAIASPWWVTVVLRDGLTPFLNTMHSHGGVGGSLGLQHGDPRQALVTIILGYAKVDLFSLPIYLLGLLGLSRCVRKKMWLLPLWTLALCLLMPEGQRFIALPAAGAASIPLREILPAMWNRAFARSTRLRAAGAAAMLLLVSLFSMWHLLEWEFSAAPELTVQRVAAASWLLVHTPRDARFLVLSDQQDAPEWFPFLAHRVPSIGHWGAEWTGRYGEQGRLTRSMQECTVRQSWSCAQSLLHQKRLTPSYLVLINRPHLWVLQAQIDRQPGWREVYANGDAMIWTRVLHRHPDNRP
jgi:hypothetical protein